MTMTNEERIAALEAQVVSLQAAVASLGMALAEAGRLFQELANNKADISAIDALRLSVDRVAINQAGDYLSTTRIGNISASDEGAKLRTSDGSSSISVGAGKISLSAERYTVED